MRAHAVALLLVLVLVAGCAGGSSVAGKYAYLNWNHSVKQCNNGVCTYGQNTETLKTQLRCDEATTLSWDLQNWIHGSMSVAVYDPSGAEKHRRTLSANGNDHVDLNGTKGVWRLEGNTLNANGNLQVRLTCN